MIYALTCSLPDITNKSVERFILLKFYCYFVVTLISLEDHRPTFTIFLHLNFSWFSWENLTLFLTELQSRMNKFDETEFFK